VKENEKENQRTIELDNKQNYSLKDKIPSTAREIRCRKNEK
jgi:hypothetical protein